MRAKNKQVALTSLDTLSTKKEYENLLNVKVRGNAVTVV
jgi:hypothetical protein